MYKIQPDKKDNNNIEIMMEFQKAKTLIASGR